MAHKNKPLLSVIIPALNEAGAIGTVISDTLSEFERFGIPGEIIVVNDGSTDDTEKIAKGFAEKNGQVRLLNHSRPEGIGKSFMDGSLVAEGEYITMLPGDNENIPGETLKLMKYAGENDAIVPFVENPEVRGAYRQMVSWLFMMITNLSFLSGFNYTNGTNIYRTSAFRNIRVKSRGFFYQTEILVRLQETGAVIIQVPYRISERTSGQNKAITLKSLYSVTGDYMKLMRDIWLGSPGS